MRTSKSAHRDPGRGRPSWRDGRRAWRPLLACGTTLLACAAGVAAAGGSAGAHAPHDRPPPPTLRWSACAQDATAQCAVLRVPIDWGRPGGPRFGLAVARRTATDPAHRIGSLVFGPGGPGDSGVDRIVTGIDRFSDRLRSRFDIVSFDPRGIGGSHPVMCSGALMAAAPSPLMTGQADFDATLTYNRRLAADCRARTGPLFDHVDTRSMARDLDALRAALGERTLTFHGSSYGTLLGETYAELFPHRIRAMVLESSVDHSQGTRAFLDSQAATEQDSFDQFVAWCGRAAGCALHGRDVRGLWQDLLARAAAGRLADPDHAGAALSPFALSVLAQKAFYGPDWSQFAATLAALDTAPPPAATPATRGGSDGAVPNPFTPVYCADWNLPVRDYAEYAGYLRHIARIAPDMRYPRALLAPASCLGWPAPRDPQHRLRVAGGPPILLINALHDPASGYGWATAVTRQLHGRGVLLTYEGSGHGSYSRGECMTGQVDRYLTTLVTPARGARCPAVGP